MDKTRPERRPNRLKTFDYTSKSAYFVTFCVRDGRCLLWEKHGDEWTHALSDLGKIVDDAIKTTDGYGNVCLPHHVIMPNHVHMIIMFESAGRESKIHLSNIVRFIKSNVTRAAGQSIWQKSYYDHIIRDEKDYMRIREYIENNPEKWKEDRYYRP